MLARDSEDGDKGSHWKVVLEDTPTSSRSSQRWLRSQEHCGSVLFDALPCLCFQGQEVSSMLSLG